MISTRISALSMAIFGFALSLVVFSSCNSGHQQETSTEATSAERSRYAQIFEPIPAEAEAPADNPMTDEKNRSWSYALF